MRKTLLVAALALMASAAHAAPISYDYVEGGFGEIDEADALFLGGSKSLDKNLFMLGSAYVLDLPGGGDGFYLEGGLGYHLPLNNQTDLFFNGQLIYADIDTRFGGDDDLGAILRAGVRYMPVEKVELEGSLAASSNDLLLDDGLGVSVSGRYHFTPQFSGAVGLHSDTELDGVSFSVRYAFR